MKTLPGIFRFVPSAATLAVLLCAFGACRTSPPPPPPSSGSVPLPPARADGSGEDDAALPDAIETAAAERTCNLCILRWNPDYSTFTADSFLEGIDRLRYDGIARTSWSLHDWTAIKPSDWGIFARVGGDDPASDGIAGLCRVSSPTYEAPSWRGDGTTARYAEIDFTLLNDPSATGFLSAGELERLFPSIDWHGGHSGVPVPPDIAARLALVLADRLAAADPSSFPADSFAAAESGRELASRLVSGLCPGLRADAPDSPADADSPTLPLRIAPDWPEPFDPADTVPSTFHTPSGDITVPFMNRDVSAVRKTLAPRGWTAFVLPLAGDTFEVLLLVPPRGTGPEAIADGIPEALASEQTTPGRTTHVFLGLPKISVQASGPVLRNACLDLDEGSYSTHPSTVPPPPSSSSRPVRLLLNRPFVLALRDTRTSSLLLLSTILTPQPSGSAGIE